MHTSMKAARRAALATGMVTALAAATVLPATAAPPTAAPEKGASDTASSTASTNKGKGPTEPAQAIDGERAQVTGPLPSSEASHPFGGAAYQEVPQDLSEVGYVEEEYLASGESDVYSWPADAPAVVRTQDAPYTTRVLVRRPADADDFSGNIVVEMLNPSNLFDLNIGWALAHEQMIANGDTWVGITAKPIAVDALKSFDADRYGDLSFANPLPLDDPANCETVAADSSRDTENGLVWDIYTQVGNWLRSDDATNPLTYGTGATEVSKAYGLGYSQTGGYLINYMKAIHPLVVQSQGRPTYDAYLVGVAGGAFAGAYPMNQCEPAPPAGDSRRTIYGVGVPVTQLMSQSDYLTGIGSRRPDSDTAPDQFRHYEMAGAGHATPDELYYSARSQDIVAADRDVPPQGCDQGPRSRFPSDIFFNAALRNLDRWVREDVPPPHADPIVVKYGQPVLDEFGNVQGGIRSPYLEVPTSTWYGNATGASFCRIAGWEDPFDQDRLAELYDVRRGRSFDYALQVRRSARQLERAGFLTSFDADQIVQEARTTDIFQ
ncbi:alpha/beta hydrolase domain-containing protein [uncultured Pseudokineococcus sp.]|uniref:alpha/beta hydrolase domain-containing protein n=3 Tax=uncultured Pseudokineococcus sp. TaxID=1642928 RepID=UPI00261EAEC8|nr:alpha/beta hydrolase domain-containing protein [uncultured Pseudokineococcus sp.]